MRSVKDSIAARHSVRAYTGELLNADQVEDLLDTGRNAPSSLNSQPWRFKVVNDATTIGWFGQSEVSRKQTWLAQAGAIIVCCADLEGYLKDSQASAFYYRDNNLMDEEPLQGIEKYVAREKENNDIARFGAAAMNVGIAVSFMMLRAVEMGLGTCWVGMFNEQVIKEKLGIDPNMRVVCLLAVGKESGSAEFVRNRKAMKDIVLP